MIPVHYRQDVRTELIRRPSKGATMRCLRLSKEENGYVSQSTYRFGVVIERRLDGGV
jgi:hypothetical protein